MKTNWNSNIIEFVGPAGAGKTSLKKFLPQFDEGVEVVKPPDIKSFQDLPLYIVAAVYSLPIISLIAITTKRGQDRISRKQISWLILLNWFRLRLKNGKRSNCRLVVIDQGPVYLLSVLYKFGPENFNEQLFRRWWKKVFTYFAGKLKLIVWLDASNEDLIQRIKNRSTWHTIKKRSLSSSNKFLTETRDALEQAISLLTAGEVKPQVVRFDTSKISQKDIINKILSFYQ